MNTHVSNGEGRYGSCEPGHSTDQRQTDSTALLHNLAPSTTAQHRNPPASGATPRDLPCLARSRCEASGFLPERDPLVRHSAASRPASQMLVTCLLGARRGEALLGARRGKDISSRRNFGAARDLASPCRIPSKHQPRKLRKVFRRVAARARAAIICVAACASRRIGN